jgi:cytidylate kinase
MNIMIAGLTGAGKTTHARLLAAEFQLRYISGSAIRLKHVHPAQDHTTSEFWRTSSDAKVLDHQRLEQPNADLAADEEMRQMSATEDGLVFDVWMLPWLSKSAALRIWFECSLEIRARRVLSSLSQSTYTRTEITKLIDEKDMQARQFMKLNYGFDLFTDRSPFNIILNTGYLTAAQATEDHDRSVAAIHQILRALVICFAGDRQRGRELFSGCFKTLPEKIFLRYPTSALEHDGL